tara:strand:+ start:239 stop:529 length:291 start_codon:yes stop_codon:yes gene_type:complete
MRIKLFKNIQENLLTWLFVLGYIFSNLSVLWLSISFYSNSEDFSKIYNNTIYDSMFNLAYLFFLLFIIVAAYRLYKWIKRVGLLAPIKSDSDTSET